MRLPLAPLVPVLGILASVAGCSPPKPSDDPALPPTEPQVVLPVDCQAGPVPGEAPLRLLTRRAYDATLAYVLGDVSQPSAAFPPENQMLGFNNGALAHQATPLLVSEMMHAAEGVAERAVQTRLAEMAPCASGGSLECGRAFVQSLGKKLFRRPLLSEEVAVFERLFAAQWASSVVPAEQYPTSIAVVLQAMLQSPQFLYRVESVRPPAVESTPALLGGYEMATRLSYFLTESAPDDALLELAAQDALGTEEAVEAQARRLLQVPRARSMVADFHHQWLGLAELGRVVREQPGVLPPADLGGLLQGSLAGFVDSVFWENGSFEQLFSSNQIFLNEKLAPLFGHSLSGSGFTAVSEPGQRFGLLTQPALMAALAHPNQTAPVFRGVFVREHLLCAEVPPPPPNVNAVAPDPDPKATTRERFAQHTASAECSACHALIDPLGFGFENYDQFGRFRSVENGQPVDASGALEGLSEAALVGPFAGPAELASRIAASSSARDCLATQWFRFAAGRAETAADLCSLNPIKAEFQKTGDLREVLVKIAVSDSFRYRAPYVLKEGSAP